MKKLTILVMVLLLAGNTHTVRADDAPDWTMTGALGPQTENPIVMQKEIVHFDIPFVATSTVPATVTFWFNNPTNAPLTISSFFPTVRRTQLIYGPPEGGNNYYSTDTQRMGSQGEDVYAENVRVLVDNIIVSSTSRIGTIPVRNTSGTLVSLNTTGVAFPFTIPAHGTTEVKISFDSPTNGNRIYYYLGSGSGWSGKIGSARFEIQYPVPHQPESIITAEKGDWNGDVYIFNRPSFEPDGFESFDFQLLWPEQTQELTHIRQAIAASPKDPTNWMQLAQFFNPHECYWQTGCGPFLNPYLSALNTSLKLTYGMSLSTPKTLDDAAAIAQAIMYTPAAGESDAPATALYANVAGVVQLPLYVDLMRYVASHGWPANDRDKLLELLRRDYVFRYETLHTGAPSPLPFGSITFTERDVATARAAYLKNGGTLAELDAAVEAIENPTPLSKNGPVMVQPTSNTPTVASPAATDTQKALMQKNAPTLRTTVYILFLAALLGTIGWIFHTKLRD